jgi:hypothetical protein
MWPFKRKPESPDEKEALAKLDEATREVAWDEEEKEADRERTGWQPGPLITLGRRRPFRRVAGDPVPEPVDDPDPGDEHGLRDALRDGEEKG